MSGIFQGGANVGMQQYEGFNGFTGGFGQEYASVEDFQKALTAGYQAPRHDGGGALRVESLEASLKILTYNAQHPKLWPDLNKMPAFSTVEEYTVQTSYGGDTGPFTREGEPPQSQDASYERRAQFVKFLGTQREVSHVMTLVRPAHGNVIALETINGTNWLIERLERALFFGRSDTVPESFDGLDKQISDDAIAAGTNIIDLRGGVLTEDKIEEATNIIVQNYGVPSDIYLAPRALSDVAKQFYPKERIPLPAPQNGVVGLSVNAVRTNSGLINLKSNIFLRSGKNNGVKTAPAAATAPRAPNAPITGAYGTPGAASGSLFAAGDAGTYQYKVTAINRFGESAPLQETGGVIVAAGDGVSLVITDGGGSDGATGYRVYRSLVGGAVGTEQFIAEVPRVGAAATTTWVDLNQYLPGTSRAYMVQLNVQAISFRQLAPMIKIPLATLGPSIRWMQLIYGTPIVYAPNRHVIFINVADS